MYKIEMIRVYNSSLKIYVFALLINILLLIIKPPSSLAQNLDLQLQASTKLSQQSQQGAVNTSPKALEPEILSEINRVRTNPQGYAQWLEEQRQYYDGISLKLPGEEPIRINKGLESLEEAIAFLQNQEPLPALSTSEANAIAANTQLTTFATQANSDIDNITYGRVTAKGIVMGLIVDDGFPDRRHRMNLLNPHIQTTGVVCQSDPRYNNICAIAYNQTSTNLAAEPQPETPNTDVVVEPQPENSSTSDSTAAESIPQPPQPTAPPDSEVASASTTASPEIETKVETPQVDTEEPKDLEVPQPESPPEIDTSSADDQPEELENNQEQEIASVSVPTSDSPLLEKAEQGVLETGDSTIPEDGSFYDSYPLEANAGDSFTIFLESDEFDAFVALIDSKGNIIEQNDDINDQDSNSRIRVTIPDKGVYNVIVNAYDQGGKGKYVLTVSR